MAYDRRKGDSDQALNSLRPQREQTFEVKIASAFAVMRADSDKTARETNLYADKISGLLGQLEEIHLRKHTKFQTIKEHSNMNKEMFDGLFSSYSSLVNEFGPRRIEMIRAGENATRVQSVRMRKSRKDIMDAAKRRLDEGREKQQLAADASELMKYYKALMMAA